jgi:hypothetical protein
MKYFQPSYTRIADKMKVRALRSRMSEYQAALRFCLYAHASTDGEYQADVASSMVMEFNDEILKHAMQHVEEIFDTLDINSYVDYLNHLSTIYAWFDNTVYRDGIESVCVGELWYERHWKKATVKAATSNSAVLFFRDYARESADAVGLAVALDGKKIQTLQYGRGMENQSKRIINAASKFLRSMKDKTDIGELMKRRERSHSIDDQFTRERSEMINKCANEILGHARYIVFTQPLNYNDREYYVRNGYFELAKFLRLIEVMARNESAPVEYSEYDMRTLAASFDESNQMRTDIASAISKSIVPYGKARKTVK